MGWLKCVAAFRTKEQFEPMAMITPDANSRQKPDEIVDIASWSADEDFPIYPIGSKPKRLVICPSGTMPAFLQPSQGYLFKEAVGWQSQQLWSEVIAYQLSLLFGVSVPPALVAVDSSTRQAGALIELFYPYPASTRTIRLVHAADFMQGNFADGKKGRPHALRENLAICRGLKAPDPLLWWAKALLFDTLIGNTDRHSENWGFLVQGSRDARRFVLAPLYDNGTSLGYGTEDAKVSGRWGEAQIAAYIAKGCHDIGWSKLEDGPTSHLGLTVRFFATYPKLRAEAASLLAFTDEQVDEIVQWATTFVVPVVFTAGRGRFIVDQIGARRDSLRRALGL